MSNKIDRRCFVEDCYIQNVSNFENGAMVYGKFLWAIVIEDRRDRFRPGFFVYTSRIETIEDGVFHTRTGSEYVPIGQVFEIDCSLWQYAMMRKGTHPLDVPSTIDEKSKKALLNGLGANLALEIELSKLCF